MRRRCSLCVASSSRGSLNVGERWQELCISRILKKAYEAVHVNLGLEQQWSTAVSEGPAAAQIPAVGDTRESPGLCQPCVFSLLGCDAGPPGGARSRAFTAH